MSQIFLKHYELFLFVSIIPVIICTLTLFFLIQYIDSLSFLDDGVILVSITIFSFGVMLILCHYDPRKIV